MRAMLCTMALAVASGHAAADESSFRLKDGPGREVVEAHCSTCHSLDYIEMNSPFLDRKGWQGSVGKMVTIMGAPISEEHVAAIVEYLNKHYGK